jgi:hypothetical protein
MFLDAVMDEASDEKWTALVSQFGKYRSLNPKTANFTTHGYTTLTRLLKLLTGFSLTDRWSLSLENLKSDVGARFKILLLHDIGGTLINRDKELPTGPNGETNPNFIERKHRYIYVRPGAIDYIKRI